MDSARRAGIHGAFSILVSWCRCGRLRSGDGAVRVEIFHRVGVGEDSLSAVSAAGADVAAAVAISGAEFIAVAATWGLGIAIADAFTAPATSSGASFAVSAAGADIRTAIPKSSAGVIAVAATWGLGIAIADAFTAAATSGCASSGGASTSCAGTTQGAGIGGDSRAQAVPRGVTAEGVLCANAGLARCVSASRRTIVFAAVGGPAAPAGGSAPAEADRFIVEAAISKPSTLIITVATARCLAPAIAHATVIAAPTASRSSAAVASIFTELGAVQDVITDAIPDPCLEGASSQTVENLAGGAVGAASCRLSAASTAALRGACLGGDSSAESVPAVVTAEGVLEADTCFTGTLGTAREVGLSTALSGASACLSAARGFSGSSTSTFGSAHVVGGACAE